MNSIAKYGAIFVALFIVALAPAAATSILYAGNAGYTIYPTLVNDSNTTFVAMYNPTWSGPSLALEQLAWATVNNASTQTGGFYDYDIVFYDMGEFWYYPFGNNDSNGTYVGPGAYDLAGNNTTFIALRSASLTTGSHLTPYPFAIIDNSSWTQNGSYYLAANNTTQTYLLNFFNGTFYDANDDYFIGNATQANDFVNYVLGI